MKVRLEDICDIETGIGNRPKDSTGEVLYIKPTDISHNGFVVFDDQYKLAYRKSFERNLVQKGDVVFVAKGSEFKAGVVDGLPGMAVVSNLCFLLRPKAQRLLPEYLVWLIDQPVFRREMAKYVKGSTTQSISKRDFCELEIPLPTIATQKSISAIAILLKRKSRLERDILERRTQIIERQLNSILKEQR